MNRPKKREGTMQIVCPACSKSQDTEYITEEAINGVEIQECQDKDCDCQFMIEVQAVVTYTTTPVEDRKVVTNG